MSIETRLAVICSHPVQYYAPLFRQLAANSQLRLQVFYTWSQREGGSAFDSGFGRPFQWDIPLLEGYPYRFVANVARRPGTDHFWGLRNPRLIQEVEDWQPDALLIYGWSHYSHLKSLRHFKGRVPVFFRGDSTLLDQTTTLRAAARQTVLRWVYRHIDAAIAVGQNNRDYYLWCGVPSDRVLFAPHAIDTVRFGEGGEQRKHAESWRQDLGIGIDEVAIVFAGKLQPKKDPQLLLQAYSSLANAVPVKNHLIFVGDGILEQQLRHAAKLLHNVHFLPFQNQSIMPAVYRMGDVFVLPSRGPGETWGLAINEAMASGKAVIASSKAGATRDLVRHGRNGWVFTSGDLGELTEALRQAIALGRRGLWAMGEESRRIIASWSIQECAARIVAAVSAPKSALQANRTPQET